MNENILTTKLTPIFSRSEIKGYSLLEEIALNLRWSWNHSSDIIWSQLEESLWNLTHNPWAVLQTVSCEKLIEKLSDLTFYRHVEKIVSETRAEMASHSWFEENHGKESLTGVAYFCMEYMLTEALPIYSGGLGNVAGDQLKAASELGVPVVAIGLLYQQGYFRQMIDKEGTQQSLYPYNDPGQLPITPLRKSNGEWLRLEISLPGYSLWLRAWQVQVGRVKLYLLDSNDSANFPAHRGITSELYGGDSELRLKQELLLGIGGWRLLEALGISPEVCHLNEGHAAFAVLERARSFMKATGQSFSVALSATRAGNLFTTHTAVPAGFDRFSSDLIEQYLGKYAKDELGISVQELLALGRQNPSDMHENFNMAYLAMHGCGAVNGVSRLHSVVSRNLFASMFPHWPDSEVPVGYVTNGVHMSSWDSLKAHQLMKDSVKGISDENIWEMRSFARHSLVEYSRVKLTRQLEARGVTDTAWVKNIFDGNTLTLGFARRFATYKRPNMLLQDPDRLLRILTNSQYPVQLVIAGKAHPADNPGIALIREWMQFIRRKEARSHVVFISDYDILVAEQLVQGVDVWINTPRRPWEACGTSGMKVLVNGGLNLSVLDGWWAEAYTPEVGWALGDGKDHENSAERDKMDALALYDILEQQVIPEFYHRDVKGLPNQWVVRIRQSMEKLIPQYSATRTVKEYTEKYYLPAAKNYHLRAANQGALGKQISEWKSHILEHWGFLRFTDVKIEKIGEQFHFEVRVYLDSLGHERVKLELYADSSSFENGFCQDMIYVGALPNDPATHLYRIEAPAVCLETDYTARIVPVFPGVSVPLEIHAITWQH